MLASSVERPGSSVCAFGAIRYDLIRNSKFEIRDAVLPSAIPDSEFRIPDSKADTQVDTTGFDPDVADQEVRVPQGQAASCKPRSTINENKNTEYGIFCESFQNDIPPLDYFCIIEVTGWDAERGPLEARVDRTELDNCHTWAVSTSTK